MNLNIIETKLKIYDSNTKCYYIKGTSILHREDEPAIEYANGDKCWYQHGKRHRLDGPAVEYADGGKVWYQNDKYHRLDGPAVENTNGSKSWYIEGKLHRLDGPAVEYANDTKRWYLDDKRIDCTSQQEFEDSLEFRSFKLKAFW